MSATVIVMLVALAGPAAAQPELPPGHPPTGGSGHSGPMNEMRRTLDREIASAEPSREVPAGSIRVKVVDDADRPVAGADVRVGIMGQDQARDQRVMRTGPDGIVTFSGLGRGTGQAYRVNVPVEGATYSSTPFQLPMDRGYDVKISRLATTRDDRTVLQFVAETLIELRDDRLHVVQRTQLVNLGDRTYVFPENGKVIRLPEGYLAFQTEPMMTDQRVDQVEGVGLKLRGSLPPGRVTLVWAYDLRISGSEMSFVVQAPWRTYIFAVAAQAPRGLDLEASGLPPAEVREDEGERMLVTSVQRSPEDPPLGRVTVTLSGIPGPGPWRWLAVFFAMLLMLGGLIWALVDGRVAETAGPAALASRRRELLDEAKSIELQHAAGEIGPVYRERQMERVLIELAAVLRAESARKAKPAPGAKAAS